MIADFCHASCNHIQGPIHFNENRIQEVSKLYILQYRTTYVNGTQIHNINNGGLTNRMSLIPVAYVCRDSKNLEFEENKNSIWPGIMSTVFNLSQKSIFYVIQIISHTMGSQERNL